MPVTQAAFDKCIDQVCEHIVSKGGYDGILGFSQGFNVTMAVAERIAAVNEKCTKKVTFLAGFGVALTTYASRDVHGISDPYVVPPAAHTDLGPLKVFLCTGNKDPHSGETRRDKLATMWAAAGAVVKKHTNSGGHRLPAAGDLAYAELDAFI